MKYHQKSNTVKPNDSPVKSNVFDGEITMFDGDGLLFVYIYIYTIIITIIFNKYCIYIYILCMHII